jgi:uncharacterized ferredoxin-like protein
MDFILGCLQPKPLSNVNSHICQICGDDVGVTLGGEMFVACNECGFPVCRPCYEYERKDGTQSCPQCRTRYKRHKGVIILCCPPLAENSLAVVSSNFNLGMG